MTLCVISHVPFYRRDGRYCCTPGFAELLEMVSPIWDRIDLCVPVSAGEPARGAHRLGLPNVTVRPLPPYSRRSEKRALAHPFRLGRALWPHVRRSRAVWIMVPNYLSIVAWVVCLLQGKRFAVRLAGDWAEIIRLGFVRVGHPWVGHVVAGLHRLAVLGMTRTARVAFANGYGLWRRYGGGNPRVVHIVSSTYYENEVARQIAPGHPAEPRVLYVGAMNFSKGLLELFEAVRRLDGDGLAFRVHLAGGGVRRSFFQKTASEMGIQDRVEFVGWVPHDGMAELYRSADVFVLPSYTEGCPKVVIEAMANGVPVVGTRVGGIPYVVRDGKDGLVVPPRDVDALYEALRTLLTDEALRKRMARSALSRARLFTVEKERATVAAGFRTFGLLRNCSESEGEGDERSRPA